MSIKRSREDSFSEQSAALDAISLSREVKYALLDPAANEIKVQQTDAIICSLPPHSPQEFTTIPAYEAHAASEHNNRCRECRRNFPSSHLLDLHITENHDPFFASRREQNDRLAHGVEGKHAEPSRIYACFVERCDKLCSNWKKRRSHLIDKHGFPRNYDFFVVNSGIDGRSSLLRPGVDERGHRASSRERTINLPAPSTEEGKREDDASDASPAAVLDDTRHENDLGASNDAVSDLAAALQNSSLQPQVPQIVSFGKRRTKSGFAKR